jgi:hypothetical protein
MGLRELLEHEAGLAHSAEREPTSGLEYLKMFTRGAVSVSRHAFVPRH